MIPLPGRDSRFSASHAARRSESSIATTDKPDVYRVTGDLAMHGHTRPVTFVATVVRGAGWATARAQLELDRREFGLVYAGPLDQLAEDVFVVKIWAQGTSRGSSAGADLVE